MLWYLTVQTSDLKKWKGRHLGLPTQALEKASSHPLEILNLL